MKAFPKVVLQSGKEKDIKTWVTETLEEFEGIPITESSRDFILCKYEEFKNLIAREFLDMFLEPDVNYSEAEWELHNLLVNIVKAFSNALNECNKKLYKNLYDAHEYKAKKSINRFDTAYEIDGLDRILLG